MKKYEVVISESVAKYIEVKANSEEEAIKMVKEGFWSDEDVINCNISDKPIATYCPPFGNPSTINSIQHLKK